MAHRHARAFAICCLLFAICQFASELYLGTVFSDSTLVAIHLGPGFRNWTGLRGTRLVAMTRQLPDNTTGSPGLDAARQSRSNLRLACGLSSK
jgi:hypothetical protein